VNAQIEPLFVPERHARIRVLLQERGRVSVAELCALLGVSEVTIRRDLAELEAAGQLRRTHGGAVPRQEPGRDDPFAARAARFAAEKARIAAAAAALVGDGETIFLDAGTTTTQVACALAAARRRITVVTNALSVCIALADAAEIAVIAVGGQLRRTNQSFVGPVAEATVRQFNADRAILGTSALSLDRGLCMPDLLEAQLQRVMIERSRDLVVVADRSKIGREALVSVAPLERVGTLITDDAVDAVWDARLRACEMQVARV